MAGTCLGSCGEDEVRVGAACEPADTQCPEGSVLADGACVPCGRGEVVQDGKCVCDFEHFVTAAPDGSCTACTDNSLEFDAALGRCLCRDGGALSAVDNIPVCTACESGVLNSDGSGCVAACPQTRVLRRSGDRLLCEECPDYAYYNAGLRETVCVSYARCRLGLRMEPRIVYEGGRGFRVCALPPARTSLKIGDEWLPDASAALRF